MNAFILLAAGLAAAQTTGFDVSASGAVLHRIEGDKTISYRRSEDGGKTWTAPVRVDKGLPAPYRFVEGDARVAGEGANVLVVWSAKGKGPMGTGALVLARSEDGGGTWAGAASPSGEGDFGRRFPALAAGGGRFTLAWLDRKTNAKVLAATSDDAGKSWSAPAVLDDDVCECCWNAVLSDEKETAVLYRDTHPRDMAVATNDGKSWSTKVAGPKGWNFNGCPHVGGALARAGGKLVALVWTGKDEEMGLHLVEVGGKPIQRLGGGSAKHADLAGAGGTGLAAVWDDAEGVWAATNDAGGSNTWNPMKLAPAGSSPRVVAAGGRYRAFWLEKTAKGARVMEKAL